MVFKQYNLVSFYKKFLSASYFLMSSFLFTLPS